MRALPVHVTDSEMAKSFACGKDKTSYIIKFDIAPHFQKKLVASVNKAGPFVLMFDESLNTKIRWTYMFVFWRMVV